MQITGTSIIAAPGERVWSALTDPDILRRCLPGCESVERLGAEDFKIVMTAAVGPLKARFNGKLRMTDARPPTDCVLHFEGQGGAMGFGKGMSRVSLRVVPEGTELTYTAEAQVGGKLAQVGSRLIDNVARKMSDDFFLAFRDQLAPPVAPASKPVDARRAAEPTDVVAAGPAVGPAEAKGRRGSEAVLVPGWWLAVAACLGALAAIAGGFLLR